MLSLLRFYNNDMISRSVKIKNIFKKLFDTHMN
jgi:hypothetical protein